MNYSTFIGIDVSKLTFDAFICQKNHKKAFANNEKGFSKLICWVEKELGIPLPTVLVCFEHTGIYSLNLSLFLQQKSICFAMVPALDIKRSLGITRGKNDQIDANRIAQYAYEKREKIKPSILPSKSIRRLQPLLTLRNNLVSSRARFLSTKGEQSLFLENKEHKSLFECYDKLINDLSKRISDLEQSINTILESDPELCRTFSLLKGIKGIGPLISAYLIIYTHNFSRFDSWRKFACYAGVAPFEHSSGTSVRGRTKVCQLANRHIKSLLFLAANSAVVYDKEMKRYYQRRLEEGKSKMSTLNIIKNKLIARAFAVAKRQTEYVNITQFAS